MDTFSLFYYYSFSIRNKIFFSKEIWLFYVALFSHQKIYRQLSQFHIRATIILSTLKLEIFLHDYLNSTGIISLREAGNVK